jgi:UDP-N-acetylglucosamine 3-dehydrogenase
VIRLAIIGAGLIARQHAASAARHPNAQLVAIGAIDRDGADQLAAQYDGVRAAGSLDELLAPGDIDALIVATPTDTHEELACAAMRRGVHVFVEKPMARTLDSARRIVDTAAETGRVLGVGHVIRYFPEYQAIERSIRNGDLGDVAVATFGRQCQQPDWSPDGWHTSMERSGGVVVDMMIHDVDLVRWYFGEPTRVFARSLGSDRHNGLDYAVATLTVPDGPICHLVGNWAEPAGFSQYAEICGTDGMLTYDSRGKQEVQHARHAVAADAATALPPPPPDDRDPFLLQQADWLGEIEGRSSLVNDGAWALRSLEIALAMLASSESGIPVDIAPRATEVVA